MIKTGKELSILLPEYHRTPHLSYKPNATSGDMVDGKLDSDYIFTSSNLIIEEKIDGANCAVMWNNGEIIVRNRKHILKKGFLKDTAAKLQFRSLWTWIYDHYKQFEVIERVFGGRAGIYAEWCWALHGIIYDKLPDYFISWGIYDPENRKMIDAFVARQLLKDAGFHCPPLLHRGFVSSWGFLEELCNQQSLWGSERREGIYVKDSEGGFVTRCSKMVRADFKQGCRWNPDVITKQLIIK